MSRCIFRVGDSFVLYFLGKTRKLVATTKNCLQTQPCNSGACLRNLRKWKTSIVLLPLSLYYCINYGKYTLLDNADLVIHEAGHVFFYFFGQFIHMAGGTLMQILLPLLIVWYFIKSGYLTGTQFSLFWLAHNFLNISVYAGDAEKRALPLLGNGTHDWYYMLSRLGILDYSEAVSALFFLIALIVFILSIITPVFRRSI